MMLVVKVREMYCSQGGRRKSGMCTEFKVKEGMDVLGAHLTPHLTCLHLAIPGFDRLLLTCSHIPLLHLISYSPSLKSLLWEDERESNMIEVTGPVVH